MKNELLLTPELRTKVEQKIRECFDIAEKEYNVKLEMPEIRYNIKSWMGGLAYHQKWLIRLNLILLVENEEHYLNTTVPHEAAHLITRTVFPVPKGKKRLMPHGKEWKAVMALLNIPAAVYHTYDCSSIEKMPKAKRKNAMSRVERLVQLYAKMTADERIDANILLNDFC